MSTEMRKRHIPEQGVVKVRGVDAMLDASQDLAAVMQRLEVREVAYHHWRVQ